MSVTATKRTFYGMRLTMV